MRLSAFRLWVIVVSFLLLSLNRSWARPPHGIASGLLQATATFSISPGNPRIAVGGKLQFQASSAATWKANCGSIVASTGAYTAPSWSGRCSITATATSGATATAVAEVGLPIETTAASQVHALARQQFVAGVPVTWTASCGSITPGGLFTAPAVASTCTVTATAAGGVRRGQSRAAISLANYTRWKNSLGGVAAETDEFQLTPASVSSGRFFQSWTMAVDGAITGQPLYMNALTVAGKARNVVFVATSNDTVYAFDADIGGVALWTRHLLATGETAVPFVCVSGYTPQAGWNTFGVLSTPVINPATNTLYVVAETIEGQTHSTFPCGGQIMHHLHALDLGTGQEKLGGPVDVYSAGTDPELQPEHHLQRPALLLANNAIYIGFGASMEPTSWHGFLFAFNANTLARQSPTLNTTPTGIGGGIWMSAEAPTADSNGDIYVPTGNGDFDGVSDFGSSVLKLNPDLQRLDFFTPYNFKQLNIGDLDLGSSNALVVPTQTGPFPHELIVCGKPTPIYVLNRDSLGRVGTTSDHIIQRLDGQLGSKSGEPCFSTPTIWKQNVYFAASHDVMKMFTLSTVTGMLSATPANKGSFVYNWPGANPVISSNGNNNGVVWTVDLTTKELRANDANDIRKILYINPNFGPAINWMVPTVINGHVYLGMKDEIIAYSIH